MAPPGAVGDEDALPDGQRAVVPQQQEVEYGVQEPAAEGVARAVRRRPTHRDAGEAAAHL